MSDELKAVLLILFICLILVCVVVILCVLLIHRRHLKIVKENSKVYKELTELNDSYNFYSSISNEYNYDEYCKSKKQLENLSFYKALKNKIEIYYDEFDSVLMRVRINRQDYEKYCKKYEELNSYLDEDIIGKLRIKKATFKNIERKLYKQLKLQPILDTNFHITARYTSPKGRNSYRRDRTFSYEEAMDVFDEYEYEKMQKEDYDYWVKKERSKMSASLRYDVLRRDGFRCQICGATGRDGVKLHVDHIFPVSKGGRTELYNLRTLCSRCNLGKRDKVE